MKNPKELYFVLRKKYFMEILKGEKKEEYRYFNDFYISRLCETDKDGEILGMKEYDTVRFQLGYSKDAPQIVLEVKSIFIESEDEEAEEYTSENCNFVIELGNIVDQTNCEDLLQILMFNHKTNAMREPKSFTVKARRKRTIPKGSLPVVIRKKI